MPDDPTRTDVVATSLEALVALLRGRRIAVLTGAGISTESGIPDYRGPETRRRARNPIQGREFVTSEEARRRYWARALLGWRRFADKAPAAGHLALAELEQRGLLCGVVTQNVDRLHHAARSRRVVELHGSLHEVICLTCGALTAREPLQATLEARNRDWSERWLARRVAMAPDGDAELDDVTGFEVVACERCDGPLKPHVVFFGEAVPKERVEGAWSIVDEADVLLVVGSSLAVFSGYRFVRGAAKRGQPIAIVNLGETRGDPHAAVRVDARAGDVLPRLVEALGA